jgi:hypothetical protein
MALYYDASNFTGLGTFAIGVPNIGTYSILGSLTLPRINQGDTANSQVIVTVNVNGGSTIYTGSAGADSFYITNLVISSANSTINVILSSSTGVDLGLNKIKMQVSVSEIV